MTKAKKAKRGDLDKSKELSFRCSAVLAIFQKERILARGINGFEKMMRDRMLQHLNLWMRPMNEPRIIAPQAAMFHFEPE